MAGSGAGSKSLKDYLKKYESNSNEEEKKKPKKNKKKPVPNRATGVTVVDEDPVWQKPVNLEEEEEGNDSADEEKPQVDEDIEVRRIKRLEQLRLRRPYNAIAEDGSGWVSLDPVHLDSKKPDSDMSPPRKQRTRNDSASPEPERMPPGSARDDTDLSPPRQQHNRQDTPSPEPYPKSVHSTGLNSDLSPPRKRRARNESPSPEPKFKPAREGSDLSPPRQQRRRYPSPETDKIPRRSSGLDSDLSLPRKRRARNDTSSPKPEHESVREDTDLSPPRQKRKQHHSWSPEPDISISRRAQQGFSNQDNDLSPLRKNKKYLGNGRPGLTDLPPRSSRASVVPDLSPPRKVQKEEKGVHRTGLITGNDIREEISKKKKEDLLRFHEMDPSVTGRGAEAVYRDKIKGGRISKEEYLKSKEKVKEKPEDKKLEWGKGLAQKREAEARLQELELEKEKPFARTRDDPELDKILKDRLRWGDPMAHLVKKKNSEPVLPDLGENEKMKESGFIIPQDIPSHSWIKRGLDAAPNRYGIRPGRHWDGVDRSNGYEKQLFKRTNEKQATEREAYLWSVADM